MEPPTMSEAEHEDAPKHGAIGHLSADEELQQAVCQSLIEDTQLDSTQIGVRVAHEIVMLSGSVKNCSARDRAITIARSLHGVADVRAEELRCSDA